MKPTPRACPPNPRLLERSGVAPPDGSPWQTLPQLAAPLPRSPLPEEQQTASWHPLRSLRMLDIYHPVGFVVRPITDPSEGFSITLRAFCLSPCHWLCPSEPKQSSEPLSCQDFLAPACCHILLLGLKTAGPCAHYRGRSVPFSSAFIHRQEATKFTRKLVSGPWWVPWWSLVAGSISASCGAGHCSQPATLPLFMPS